MYKIKKDGSGVFSNFLRAIDWFWYSFYTNDNICLDWNLNGNNLLGEIFNINQKCDNIVYETFSYVEKSGLPLNSKIQLRRDSVSLYKKYNGYFYTTPDIFFENDFQTLRNEMNKGFLKGFEYKGSFKMIPENNYFSVNDNVLGAHIRNPVHYKNSNQFPIQVDVSAFFKEAAFFIESNMKEGNFDKVYIACENSELFLHLEKLIGKEKILSNPIERTNSNIDWEFKPNLNMGKEVYNCFIDVYNLTKCKKILGSTSNMFIGALVMNPIVEFEMFPVTKKLHGF